MTAKLTRQLVVKVPDKLHAALVADAEASLILRRSLGLALR